MSNEAKDQDDVLAFLADSKTYGGGSETVKRIDTHAASVFLTKDRVLKIKRAVKFPFLDYSTLEKRKAACEAELKVNAPYAPEIYRGVIAITRETGGKLALNGSGKPIEWAVEMRRFDENRTLDHITDQIDDTLADALGRAVANAHEKIKPVAAEPWIEAIGQYVDEHFEAFDERPEIFPKAENEAFAKTSRAAYERIVPLLRERGRAGLIRHIHGDLHLGNIVLIGDRPVLFDAIEFSDLIASGDVLYDLAFLLMDLLERGLPKPANIVLNRYLAETRRDEDLDALAALPFFLALRAAIRAKVTVARMEQAKESEQQGIAKSARAYFEFAWRAIDPARPQFIAVGGLSGTGKSRLARELAPHVGPMPGAVIVRSDVERKALFGVGETDKLGEDAYTSAVTERVYALAAEKARRIVAAGHSATFDAVFARPEEREAIARTAQAAHLPLKGLFLTASLETRIARVGSRANDASDASPSIAQAQENYDLGRLEWTEIDASGPPSDTLKRVKTALSS
jgi:aminoglycoside phosphotransferase family enzyme/predicted kinase